MALFARVLITDPAHHAAGGAAGGNIAVKLLKDRRNTFWTCTGWSTVESMKAFMLAKPHGPAMRSLLEWCDEASLVRWTQPGVELPSWEEAHRRLQQEGRPSKVNHPSEAHKAHAFPPPAQKREVRLK